MLPRTTIFRLRQKSLPRGLLLACGALIATMLLAGFPSTEQLHGSQWQILPVLATLWSMVETARCLGRRWSFHHAGVLLLLCSDTMILAMAIFHWLYL